MSESPFNVPLPRRSLQAHRSYHVQPQSEVSSVSAASDTSRLMARRHDQLVRLDSFLRSMEHRLERFDKNLARRRATLYSETSSDAAPQRTRRNYPTYRRSPLGQDSISRRMKQGWSDRRQTRMISWKSDPVATVNTRITSASLGVGMAARHVCDDFAPDKSPKQGFWRKLRQLLFGI